jgi:hypothetical protein
MRRILSVPRRAALTVALVPALMATMFGFGAGVAHAAGSTSFTIFTKTVTERSVYKMTMSVFKTGGNSNASLGITFTRTRKTTTATLRQVHSYSFTIPASDVTIDGSDLLPTKIDTHSHLGKFGKVDMVLRNAGSLNKRTFRCPKPHSDIIIGRSKTRKGTLKGTFHFVGNDNFFRTINEGALGATVTKFTSTGKTCPGGGGGGCPQGFSFFASDAAGDFLSANKGLSSGKATISFGYSETNSPASIFHNISGTVPRSAFGVSSTLNVTIKGGALSPFAADTIKFTKQSASTTGKTCKRTNAVEDYASGDFLAKFDSGGQRRMGGTGSPVTFAQLTKTKKT